MTSDAKIGLLLGLVFIFIIAFIINGLPSFRKDANNNELTTNMVRLQNSSLGLADNERKAQEVFNQRRQVEEHPPKVKTPPMDNQDIRFEMALPQRPSVVKKETNEAKRVASPKPQPTVKKKWSRKVKPSEPTLPGVYIVGEGDSLAVIAKKFYGPEEGNKKINVTRIFKANSKFLKSPDEIYIGQELVIPPLSASAPDKSKIASIFSGAMFKKVESVGKRHFPTAGSATKQSGQYAVREGDSLWRIAAERLGDGSRYSEIAKLNAGVIDDEDGLVIGMRLKLPVR